MRLFRFLIFSAFWCLHTTVYAQDKELTALSKLIPELENQYDIKFNYLESFINNKKVIVKDIELVETLKSLEKQTLLRFELLEDKQVLIREFKNTDLVNICGHVTTDGFPTKAIGVQSKVMLKPVFTDENGFFELLNIPYGSNIIFKTESLLLKKKTVKVLFQQPECSNVEIVEYKEELDEIEITNYLTKGVVKDDQKVNISSTIFSVLPGIIEPDVMKSLEHIPSVQSPFEMPSKIYVRGSTPDQNLALWNGIKTFSQSHFFGLISIFNPYTVDITDFYYKGVNAEYGDRLAGVIDMKSDDQITNNFSGGAGVNLINADVFVKIPLMKDKLSTTVALRRSFTDILKTPAYDPMAKRVFQNLNITDEVQRMNDEFYFFDGSISVQAKPNKNNNIQLNALYAQNTLNFENETLTSRISDKLNTKNEGYSFLWQHNYSSRLQQHTVLNFSNYTLDYQSDNENNDTVENASEFKSNFVSDLGGKTYFSYTFESKVKLDLGYQFSENTARYSIENETDVLFFILDKESNDLRTHSVFSEFEFTITDKLLMQIGVRGNKYSTSPKIFVEPRLFVELTVFPKFKINTAATYRSQSITQIQESVTSDLPLENALWRITDSNDFNILTSKHFSVGSTYKSKGWFIEADTYYKFMDNLTTLTAGFLNPADDNTFEVGSSKTKGAELFIKKKLKRYSSWVSYNFTEQELQFTGVNDGEYYLSNLNIAHTFKWQHYYQLNNLQLGLGWLWHSGKAITNVTANKEEGAPVELVYTDLNAQNLPDYHKLDFSALYNFKFKTDTETRYQIGLSVQNVYNKKSILNREFRTTPGLDNELLTIDYYSLGFTPNLSLRVFW